MTREPIYSALFALLAGSSGFATSSRRLLHWNDVPAADQPALFMAQTGENVIVGAMGKPSRVDMSVSAYVYVKAEAGNAPGPLLNPLLDAITAALAPSQSIDNTQTLGGLCVHCWIEGQINTYEGTLGEQEVAIVPIKILATT
jgi:hypothetical protein